MEMSEVANGLPMGCKRVEILEEVFVEDGCLNGLVQEMNDKGCSSFKCKGGTEGDSYM